MNNLMKYGLSAAALICMLVMSACSEDSLGNVNYNKVTTGRMDLNGAVAIGLKTDEGETRATDGYFKSGLYKMDADGNITTVGLFVSEDDKGNEYEHQEPLRVVPTQIFTASDSYFIASDCKYFDKDDDKVSVPYKYLLVRKSDGKIWGIDDIRSILDIYSDGIRGRFRLEKGTLYFCEAHSNYGSGSVYRFNLDNNIPSFEQITKDDETYADTFHIADDGIVFSYASELHLSWPYAGWQAISGFLRDDQGDFKDLNIENEIEIPANLIVDLIPERIKEQYRFISFKFRIDWVRLTFSSIKNHPAAFPSEFNYTLFGVTPDSEEIDIKRITMYWDEDDSFKSKVINEASPYAFSQGLMWGYWDINYNKTPLSATFGDFHKMPLGNMTNYPSYANTVLEGNGYSIVVHDSHNISKIDYKSGETKFLKKTENVFGYLPFLYSDKVWEYQGYWGQNSIVWFDPESLEEGHIDISINVPDYMKEEPFKFENGNLIFEGKNPMTGNTDYIYVDILTGNARTQEVAPNMVFRTLINLN